MTPGLSTWIARFEGLMQAVPTPLYDEFLEEVIKRAQLAHHARVKVAEDKRTQ